MKRAVSIVLVALYLYNLFGYMGAFLVAQAQIRKEIKQLIKQSVPEEQLVRISITPETALSLQWIKSFEFRYEGRLYDVIRTHQSGDTIHFTCINDVKEQGLFAGLDEHVRRHMDSDARTSGANAAYKEHVPPTFHADPATRLVCLIGASTPLFPPSYIGEVPFRPPRPA